ncbi:MAG TPA: hypothetical protein PLG43_10015 [Spirochaetia bacterium]|nr:hypothetical protein [Spirochaetia bacterium]
MNNKRTSSLVRNISRGYLGIVKGLGRLFVVCCIIGIGSAALTYPLWYLAVHHTNLYTVLFVSVLCLAILWSIIRSIRNRIAIERNPWKAWRSLLASVFERIGLAAGTLILIYILAVLYLNKRYLWAVIGTIGALFLMGYILYGRKKTS